MKIESISHEALSDLMGASKIEQSVDIGCALISIAIHPNLGHIVGISGFDDSSGLVRIS